MSTARHKAEAISDLAHEDRIVAALKARRGRVTVGDILVDTGLPKPVAEAQLRRLLKIYESHLEVDENGEVVYLFDPAFKRRDAGDSLKRALWGLGKTAYKTFKFAFKITIMVTVVVYFVLFVALLIAAFVAAASRGGSSSSSSSSRRSPIFLIGRMFWVPSHSMGGYSNRGRSHAPSRAKEEPLYKRVFAYVFGPEANEDEAPDPFSAEKIVLAFLRSQKGVVTASELATQTGWGQREAEGRIASLMADYDGDVRVTRNGTLLYTFNGLALSAGGNPTPEPPPIWARYEKKKVLTGNSGGTNALITFLNGFNLLAALVAPAFIMPELQLEGPFFYIALSAFPFLFSLTFFAVPILRWGFIMLENSKRAARNTWRFVLGEVFTAARRGREVAPRQVADSVVRSYPKDAAGSPERRKILASLQRTLVDYEPEIDTDAGGELTYRFTALSRELDEAHRARKLIDDSQLRMGRIVFSSADDDLGLDQLEDFERQMGAPAPELSANRLEQLDSELGGFDAQLEPKTSEADRGELDEFEKRLQDQLEQAIATSKVNK
jgi:hypothetical protein